MRFTSRLAALATVVITGLAATATSTSAAALPSPGANSPRGGSAAAAVALSPDGSEVFITGSGNSRFATIAYDTATGARLWAELYRGPARSHSGASSIAVSPDGSAVFVTGLITSHRNVFENAVTVAYDAATGSLLWTRRSDLIIPGAHSIAVSPDGSEVFVIGQHRLSTMTVAYDAATGATLWARRYRGGSPWGAEPTAVAVSPDGSKVFVTGTRSGSVLYADVYWTVAYDAATGSTLWARPYKGPGSDETHAASIAVSPDGSKVFVTGEQAGVTSSVAYNATTGARLWVRRYQGQGVIPRYIDACCVTVSPDGSTVFVTGQGNGKHRDGYATLAYDADTGARLWLRRWLNNSGPDSLVVSPDGSDLIIAGYTNIPGQTFAAVAYNTATGATLWMRRYNGPGGRFGSATALAISPDGSKVIVTGWNEGLTAIDAATLAYDPSTGATLWVRRYNGWR